MLAKLHAQAALRIDGAGEDDEAAGFLVEPLDDAQAWARIMFLLRQLHADLPHDEIIEGEDEQAPLF